MTNAQIAQAFQKIADLLKLRDENPFRIRAYERAAQTIEALSEDLEMIHKRKAREGILGLPGIGKDLADKIEEMIATGTMSFLTELSKEVPPGVIAMTQIEGLGPKKTKVLWQKFGVESIDALEKLLTSDTLLQEKGWGKKSIENALKGIAALRAHGQRLALPAAMELAEELLRALEASKLCSKLSLAGSIRRRKETIGDIDILASSKSPEKLMDLFCDIPQVERVLAKGTTKASVHLHAGVDADLRVVEEKVFGAALHYFTGSKDHNVHLRRIGISKGLTISEYGVYEGTAKEKGKLLASRTEEDIYRSVGLPYIEPELREDRGEIEAGEKGTLPRLIEEKDIRGDLHMHSEFSDGSGSMIEMAQAAKDKGYSYIAMTDHASPMGMVKGVKEENIDQYLAMIAEARKEVPGIEILAGAEVDILEDGSLYLPDDILAKLDWVIASIHGHFKMSEDAMTKRLLRAVTHPHVHLLAHPTSRLLLKRDPIVYDLDAVFSAAATHHTALEINASVFRLDVNDVLARRAKEAGVMISINGDAHHPRELDVRFGVTQARRGWLTTEHVLNTRSLQDVRKWKNKTVRG